MFKFDRQKVIENVRLSSTEDLLARITAYRGGMEPDAIAIIEGELHRRGVAPFEIERHRSEMTRRVLFQAEGLAFQCSYCDRPAVMRAWEWHRLWGKIPVFPRIINRCEHHTPNTSTKP